METKEKYKKLCSFYVSDIHFGTMILPYLSKKLEQKNNIYTLFEKDMCNNVGKIVSSLNLNKETKEEIKSIDWHKKTDRKEIKNCISDIKNDSEVVLVMGDKKYIDNTNKKIAKHIRKGSLKNITVINSYNVDIFNENIVEILKTHDGILNTLGERKIEI